jgi:hypothetical protein
MYCDAPGTASGQPCAIAAVVEADWTSRHPGVYDPTQHLRALVGVTRRQLGGNWTHEHRASTGGGTPLDTFVVRHDGVVVVEAASVVGELAAREAAARLWRVTRPS